MAQERVQKILAQVGIASRRKAEELIQEGLVTINGKLAKLGDKADLTTDSIKVKGKLIHSNAKEAPVYVALFKPRGVISALSDPEGRATLTDLVGSKIKARIYPVGRLDFMSEGLILMTNDGAFAEKLQKMEGVPRVYHIKVRGRPDASMIHRLEKGARMGNRLIKPHSIRLAEELSNKVRIEMVLTDSGAIDVKTYFEQKGFLVESIRRTAIGQITLRGLEPGHFRFLKPSQVEALTEHPELGLRALSEDGKSQEGEGFQYRRPQGAPKQGAHARRAAQAAEEAAKPAPHPKPLKPSLLKGAPKSTSARPALPRPNSRPGARPNSRPDSFQARGKSGIRVTRKKSPRG